jgi:hypothetical protein
MTIMVIIVIVLLLLLLLIIIIIITADRFRLRVAHNLLTLDTGNG